MCNPPLTREHLIRLKVCPREGRTKSDNVGGGDGLAGGEQQRAGAKRPRSGDENDAATTEAAAGDSATDEQQRMREARLKKLAA